VLCVNSSQSLGDLQANAVGVVNEIKRLIQQQEPVLGSALHLIFQELILTC